MSVLSRRWERPSCPSPGCARAGWTLDSGRKYYLRNRVRVSNARLRSSRQGTAAAQTMAWPSLPLRWLPTHDSRNGHDGLHIRNRRTKRRAAAAQRAASLQVDVSSSSSLPASDAQCLQKLSTAICWGDELTREGRAYAWRRSSRARRSCWSGRWRSCA